ncbi:MAG: hypothetical protein ACLFTQ_03205 [Candidatus Aenigmatarchaeota archaeon]
MVYKHASIVKIESDNKVIVKPGKQNSKVEYKAHVVEDKGEKKVEGKEYRLLENIELPYAMTDAEFDFWKQNNEEIRELVKEKQKKMVA